MLSTNSIDYYCSFYSNIVIRFMFTKWSKCFQWRVLASLQWMFPKSSIVMSYCWATHVYQNSHANIKFEGEVAHCSNGFDWLVHYQKIDKEISHKLSQQIFNIHDLHYAYTYTFLWRNILFKMPFVLNFHWFVAF